MTSTETAFVPGDFATLRTVSDPQVSQDGRTQACVVHDPRPAWGERTRSEIWIAAGDTPARSVTTGEGEDVHPRLSPSGRWLAFASDREEQGLWRLRLAEIGEDVSSGDPRHFEALPGVVEDIVWADDESGLMVRIADEGSDTGNVHGAKRFTTSKDQAASLEVRRPATAWRRLFWVDLASGSVTQVSPAGLTVWEIGWAGSGPIAAVVSADPSESGWYDAELVLIDRETRSAATIYTSQWQIQCPAVSADGKTLGVIEAPQSDRALLAGTIVIIDLESGSITRPEHTADVTRIEWTRDGRLFWAGVVSVETACGFLTQVGDERDRWADEERWRGLATLGRQYQVTGSCSLDGGTFVAALQSHGQPLELMIRAADAERDTPWHHRTTVNAHLLGRTLPTESVHTWIADDGLEIHGLLLVPRDRAEGVRLPLVVVPHGGPTNFTPSVFDSGAHHGDALLLTQAGCAVLLPNVRGSTGRGRAFMSASVGDMGGGDLGDLESGVRSLVDAGLVDPDRIGIVGLSYGGFMTAWASVRSTLFAAAIPIAGVMNWLSFHNTSNLGRFDEIYLDGDPYDASGPYLQRSPVMYVNGARTPTLMLHGDEDLACPLGQAQEFYQGLAAAGCESELVIYRGAGHGMTHREHVIDVSNRIVGWFTKHLKLEVSGAPVP